MKLSIKSLLLSLAAMLFVVPAIAQVTTSSISGHVTDKVGAVEGVAVFAVYEPTATTYYALTDKNGNFRISNVTAGGPYTVKFELLGYREVINQNVYAPLAETTVVDAKLEDEALNLEAAVFVADANESGMNIKRSGAGTSVSLKTMENLPTSTGRSINDVLRLTPQATTTVGGFAVGGGNYRSSYITVDGAAFNNAFGIGSNLPAGGSPISLDAIEQMSINITPYDVRQGGFTGAAVNSVTKRGTNDFKISVYDYYTTDKVRGRKYVNADGSVGELPESDAVSNTTGVSVGGPIIKNKLFFFINAEYEPKTSPATSWLANDGTWSADGKGSVHRPTAAQMNEIKNYLATTYNYDPGRYENFSVGTPLVKLLGRIDWNINRNNTLMLRYSQVTRKTISSPSSSVNPIGNGVANIGYVRNDGGRTTTYALPFESNYYFSEDNFYSFAAELNSRLFDGKVNNLLRATYSHQNIPRSFYGDVFPSVDIMEGDAVLTSFGPDPFTYGNLRDVTTMVFTDEVTFSSGINNFLFGIQYEHNRTKNGFMQGGAGQYVYASWDDFKNNATPVSFCITHGNNDDLAQVFPSFDYNQATLYAQDEMNISDNFKLTAGIRFELPVYPSIEGNENKKFTELYKDNGGYKTSDMPKASLHVSPRIGFNWDILGDRNLILRGGLGIFTGRMPFVWIVSVAGNSNCLQNQVIMKASQIAASTDGTVNGVNIPSFHTNVAEITEDLYGGSFKRNENLAAPSGATILDKALKMPTTAKMSLALDATLPGDIKASVEGIYNRNLQSAVVHATGYTTTTMQLPGEPDTRTAYKTIDAVNGIHAYYITNPDKGVKQGYYASLTTSLRKDFAWGLNLMAAYTYSVSKSLGDGNGDQTSSAFTETTFTKNGTNTDELGYNSFVAPHRVIANANYSIKEGRHLATNLGLFYEGYNFGYAGTFAASRYSYTTDVDYTGCAGSANLIYIPTSAELANMPFADADNRTAYENFIAGDKYLSKHRGEYSTRGGAIMPWFNNLSAKVSQDFIFMVAGRPHTLRLGVDMNNVGNLLNPAWGNVKQIKSTSALSYKDGNYTFNADQCKFNTYAGSISTWNILFSARYFF
ncbi:MAG: TonB-dependent receptor [Bacteroidales bacterium]|nr:TonB-dependent receptor [Bacteroidales bacterium]